MKRKTRSQDESDDGESAASSPKRARSATAASRENAIAPSRSITKAKSPRTRAARQTKASSATRNGAAGSDELHNGKGSAEGKSTRSTSRQTSIRNRTAVPRKLKSVEGGDEGFVMGSMQMRGETRVQTSEGDGKRRPVPRKIKAPIVEQEEEESDAYSEEAAGAIEEENTSEPGFTTPRKSAQGRASAKGKSKQVIPEEEQDDYTEDVNGDDDDDDLVEAQLMESQANVIESPAITPSKKHRGRKPGSKNKPKPANAESTPTKSPGKKPFVTPTKTTRTLSFQSPSIVRNADRSARRRSARALIDATVGDISDQDEEEAEFAERIYDDNEAGEEQGEDEPPESTPAATPTKRRVGRPLGTKNRPPSPIPPDVQPPERYFRQNQTGFSRTSNNNLSSFTPIEHKEYFDLVRSHTNPHTEDISFLETLHSRSFNQWEFECSQGFNICLYGYGSKSSLLMKFAHHLSSSSSASQLSSSGAQNGHKIIVISGHDPRVSIRQILSTLGTAISPTTRLGSQPSEMLDTLSSLLSSPSSTPIHLTLIIHSFDASPLRRTSTQNLLGRLASLPQISMIASVDTPNFPLLWDSSLKGAFNWVFHDCTTFKSYEKELQVVDEVHELLGKRTRRINGREGVMYVLRSLPENAKNLFRVLVGEQLAGLEVGGEMDGGGGGGGNGQGGVEYRTLYQKASEEFICGNEMAFRTLLKEFVDHEIIVSRKDGMGTEVLGCPFGKEELEGILEDLMA